MSESVNAVPAFDYRRELSRCRAETDDAIRRVLDSGQLILGPEVQAFEHEFAAAIGVRHAVGVASGTDALILALRALEIGSGHQVITVANTAVPTVSAIRAVGAQPRFAEIDGRTLQMCPVSLKDAVSSATRCIIPVHLHGHPADMESIESIARTHSIPVIGDCAQAHGAAIGQRSVGTFGTISCYSFYPTKNLGAFGDGGMCVTDSEALADRLKQQRQYGFRGDRTAHTDGVCSRLDELQAAILRVRLRSLQTNQNKRTAIAERYCRGLADCNAVLPVCTPDTTHAWHQFVIRVPNRSELCDRLTQARIGFGIHYPVPIHRMPAYCNCGTASGDLSNTERAADEILSLPMFPDLREEEVDRVISVIRAVC